MMVMLIIAEIKNREEKSIQARRVAAIFLAEERATAFGGTGTDGKEDRSPTKKEGKSKLPQKETLHQEEISFRQHRTLRPKRISDAPVSAGVEKKRRIAIARD